MPFGDTFGTGSIPFLNQPIDVILLNLLIWTGWIPILIVFVWGFIMVYQSLQQGKYVSSLRFVMLAIDVPSATEQSPKALEHLFSNLIGAKSSLTWKEKWIIGKVHPVFAFEIVSTEGYVQFYVRTQTRFRDTIEAGIYAHYPDAEISEVEDYAANFPRKFPDEEYEMWGSEMALKKNEIFPIRTYVDFEDKMTQELKDPLAQTLESMSRMKPGEHFWIQFLVQPDGNDWKDAGVKHVDELFGKVKSAGPGAIASGVAGAISIPSMVLQEATGVDLSSMLLGGGGQESEEDIWRAFKISPTEKQEAEAVLMKIGKNGLATKTRILYWGRKQVYDKQARTAMVKGILLQYANLSLNSFGMYGPQTPKDDYFWQRWVYTAKQERLVSAFVNRSWGTGATPQHLNSEELASLWHFPAIGIKAPLLRKVESRRAEPPPGLPFTFGEESLPGAPSDIPEVPSSLPGAGVQFSGPALAMPPAELPTLTDVEPNVFVQPPTEPTLATPERPGTQPPLPKERASATEQDEAAVPHMTAPTRTESIQEDEDVPPNLPV